MRWCWPRCRRLPNASCSTTGCNANVASIPTPRSTCCELPEGGPAAGACWRASSRSWRPTRTASVVPVRVFWVPGGLPTRSKVVALISGPRHLSAAGDSATPHPASKDPSRARVVAGEPAKVSELRQQWSDTTVGENPREFARFVHPPRRAWPSNASSCACSGPNTSRRNWSSRKCWRRRGFVRDWSRFPGPPSRRPARCSTSSPPDGAGSPST